MKKLKRFSSVFLAAAMLTAAFTGCSDTASSTESDEAAAIEATSLEETEATTAEPQTDEEFYAAMVARSLNRIGNTHRLKEKLEQARSGEETTIAYIGGSITEGVGATAETCYAYLSYADFAETYGTGDNVQYVNAGLSGTPSILGNLRLDRDVLSYEPDVVFIEFAVNDGQDTITQQSYESMVKTILEQDNEPAVVIICNRLKNGYTAQEYMINIAEFYDLPVVSMADALTPELDEGRLTWEEYSDDESHPNTYGHQVVAECIAYMWAQEDAAEDSGSFTVRQGGIYGIPYENAEMITPEILENGSVDGIEIISTGSFNAVSSGTSGFPTCWKYSGERQEPLKLKVSGNSIFMIIRRNNSDKMGSFEVYLDGDRLTTISANQSDGWGEAYAEQIIKYQGVHDDMEIEIYPAEGSEDKELTILGFAFTQNTTF